jgi:hypothetical protein
MRENSYVKVLVIQPSILLVVALLLSSSGAAQTAFRFPAVDPTGQVFMEVPIIGVDHDDLHDSTDRLTCVNYAGQPFPLCYNDHLGTDFLLTGGFPAMDQGVSVVAGAAGVVVETVDGNYDRCHNGANFEVTCDGNPTIANRVTLRHPDGLQSSYWHLRKGSVLVHVGDEVSCGQALAQVGSSGSSAVPHLHLQLEDASGSVIDPYAGPRSQAHSYWIQQAGPFGRPGALCPGESPPAEARVSPVDGGAPQAPDRSAMVVATASGCSLTPAPSAPPLALLLLLALGWLVVRAGSTSGGSSGSPRARRS